MFYHRAVFRLPHLFLTNGFRHHIPLTGFCNDSVTSAPTANQQQHDQPDQAGEEHSERVNGAVPTD